MSDLQTILALALLPALGNLGGAALAEWIEGSRRLLNWALHLAAGIVLAVVAVELLPQALAAAPGWLVVLALAAGGILSLVLKGAIGAWQARRGQEAGGATWSVYIAVCVDLFSDGLMIGAGSVISLSLGVLLALGQVSADIPEGFATMSLLRRRGVGRARRMLLAASLLLPVMGGALLGYLVLRNVDRAVQVGALAFAAGLLLVAAVEDILGEAHEETEDTRASAALLVAGFCLFVLVGSYF